jgi:anti-sigma B factor antagonist
MKTEIKHEDNISIVAVSGEVDALAAPDLARAIVDEIAEGHVYLVIDLTGVEFVSTAGLQILFDAVRETRAQGGDLQVVSINPEIDTVLKMSGFHNVARVFTSDADALTGFWP